MGGGRISMALFGGSGCYGGLGGFSYGGFGWGAGWWWIVIILIVFILIIPFWWGGFGPVGFPAWGF